MRLFGPGPIKFPPPQLGPLSPALPHRRRGGLIDNLRGKKKWGVGDGDRVEMRNKENELMSNAWFAYMKFELPVVSPFQYIVARGGNEITPTIMFHNRAE